MRALAFNPQGTILASLGIDGVIRVFDIQRWERIANWQGFAGESLQFDDRGEKLLAGRTLAWASAQLHLPLNWTLQPNWAPLKQARGEPCRRVCEGRRGPKSVRCPCPAGSTPWWGTWRAAP